MRSPAIALREWVRSFTWAETAVLGFAAVTAGVAAWAGVWFSKTADTFCHLATVRSLLNHDELLASRVTYADSVSAHLPSGLDPTSGTWHLVLAVIARLSGLDIVVVWALLPALMALLLVLAFYMLATVLLQSRWWALAATVVQFTLFMDMDFRTSLYPNVITMAMLWTGLAAAVVPLVALNPLVVTYVSPRVDDIALLRLPQIVSDAFIWVAVLAPLCSRLGRLALTHRLSLAWRYASASGRRWLPPGRLRHAVPTPALAAAGGVLAGAIVATAATLGTAGIIDGLVNRYLRSEDTIYSVQDSKATALHYDEGVFGYLRENAPVDAVVLADPVSSYYISGFVDTLVVAAPWKHSPRRVEKTDGAQRRIDVAAALDGDSLGDSLRVVREYKVTHVVTDASGSTPFDGLPETFLLVYEDEEDRV